MFVLGSCKSKGSELPKKEDPPVVTIPANFVKGADISWITEQEAANIQFYNSAGVQKDIFTILKEQGMNTIRLRVWVNPSDGWCNKADVLAKALRAKAAGMRIMIDFHYADSWADPGKQRTPAAWANHDINTLKKDVYNHTVDVLSTLKSNGIIPEWVQVGNETNNGMLWPLGKASDSMANFAGLVQSGYSAVKYIDSSIKVMVHISNGYDNSLFRWIFDGLKANNTPYDVIGMSLYPSANNWQTYNSQTLSNMNDMVSRYGKEVMVVEVGMPSNDPTTCKNFISDLISKVAVVNNNKGLGVLYWEPQAYNNWKGYGLGAFDISGKPTIALDAFK
ncbi:MAG: arabinogalactan endo-1,4-beta-galactosidase [Bacteroidetes bacterium]|nr:arabinogalactan endo-1,4-beta-galactosidase [Bacteroidota bacterium]MBU1371346.1 arabinogalactan endo-1,4-beta-galactosidase [Bacteroidota bacterium]MBU1485833.1 arabinogalactan endo-1,4-beta-galactosidase [Bacteroidota bacterium]MBU1761087.1 arabinogalactan endo-1,4-beta-galactosidase [Bacteroidota bacterium]MBU2268152.1 arabinogalactan endo-1,4-beta-galactosidase [Bacteroidota bacterium]